LQAAASEDTALVQSLNEAVGRVTAVARVHERLYRSANVLAVDLAAYLADICSDLQALAPRSSVRFEAADPITMSTDRCVRVALLVTELVTNAAKHAQPGGESNIVVRLARAGESDVMLTVRDDGVGLPLGFDAEKSKGLGMKIVTALVSQTGGKLSVRRNRPGAEFVAEIPLE
jgi:two-component sensor histidine kinase